MNGGLSIHSIAVIQLTIVIVFVYNKAYQSSSMDVSALYVRLRACEHHKDVGNIYDI